MRGRDADARQRAGVPDRNPQVGCGLDSDQYRRGQLAGRLAVWTAETVLVCALTLLGRPADSFPPITFINEPPADVSRYAEAFVRTGERRIYVITSSWMFQRAQNATFQCGEHQALRKLASVLVHEEWHVTHGGDEAGAYAAQLITLAYLGSGPGHPTYYDVSLSMRMTLQGRKGR